MPVGHATIDAFHALYIIVAPTDESQSTAELIPVGQLEDLDRWLSKLHQGSLIRWAAILLTLGFFIQLSLRLLSMRRGAASAEDTQ
jgi:hypothetical protein